MIKKFKGQVAIEDVQEAFDDIVERVNRMVDAYNDSLELQDIDYSKGGTSISPSGYTLSVGGLKIMMAACNGMVIGAKAVKVSSSSLKMTTGILITTNAIYRLPDSLITGLSTKGTIYFNPTNSTYSSSYSAGYIKVRQYDLNTTALNATEYLGMQSEGFDGYYKITIPDRYPKPVADYDSGESHNDGTATGPKFICAIDKQKQEGEGTAKMYLFGTLVASNRQTGHRNLNYWTPTNYLFLPRGMSSSGIYTFDSSADNMTRYFNVKTSKQFNE